MQHVMGLIETARASRPTNRYDADEVMREHHVRMNMYIAQAKNGRFKIVESLGAIDPEEATASSAAEFGRAPIG